MTTSPHGRWMWVQSAGLNVLLFGSACQILHLLGFWVKAPTISVGMRMEFMNTTDEETKRNGLGQRTGRARECFE